MKTHQGKYLEASQGSFSRVKSKKKVKKGPFLSSIKH